jgi:hypothetical protein
MSVLQRKMFSSGGGVNISPELNTYLNEMGVDPTGKTAEQIKAEVDQKIQDEYADYSKLIFDPSDPLDYLSAGLMATGVGGLVAGPFKALRTGRKGQKIVEQLNKQRERAAKIFKENPITSTALAGGVAIPIIDSITDTGQAPDLTPPDTITEELSVLTEQEKQKEAERKAQLNEEERLKNEAEAAKQKKDEINETLRILQTRAGEFDEAEKERIGQERRDNAFTLMQEIGSAMVETGQIDRGLALGATRASERISEEQLAEKLAEDELKKKMAEEDKLSATEKNKIVTTYADAQLHLTNMDFISNELDKMIGLVESGAVTGGKGLLGRTLGKIKGFVGFGDEQIADATLAKQIGTFIRTQLVRELLNESGRTISNLDRQLIDEIVGDVADLGEGRGAILKSLERIRQRIGSSTAKSRNTVEFYKKEYGAQVPNLSIFDQQERYTPPTETEVSVTAEDVIQ